MTTTLTPAPSLAKIDEGIAEIEHDLEIAKAWLPTARRNAALAFLNGHADNGDLDNVRSQISDLDDVLIGMRCVRASAEHRNLTAEIERRQSLHDADAIRVEEMRCGAAEFPEYEQASLAHRSEAQEIGALEARRDQLEAEFPDAFEPETA